MIVKTAELKPGCVLGKDVYAKSTKPLMKAGTMLDAMHLAFLKAFLIETVDVNRVNKARTASTGKSEKSHREQGPVAAQGTPRKKISPFVLKYRQSVKDDQQFFQQWQSGGRVSIGDFRTAMLPLMNHLLARPASLRNLLLQRVRKTSIAERSVQLGLITAFFAQKLRFAEGDCVQLGLAGMLCDCGLAKLSPSLLKQERLSEHDLVLYKRHVIDSYKMLKGMATLKQETLVAVIQHHEREDGSGYPLHLKSTQLSPNGKILALCAHFQSQFETVSPERFITALDHFQRSSYGWFSRHYLDQLCYALMDLLVGMKLQLSDGRSGEITFIPVKDPTRPLIRCSDQHVLVFEPDGPVTIKRLE
ncbi:HD-GYP domain-containing protein [Sporolactobacillus terrae]|uniref:Metal-dependent phosphohydrolase n=1 Tax=Sporolactobacillus terrae TaxID=269673 RepID=A0A410D502_9BACL|nr:HD domain-containing phosphohydrolase [Sporolactobacillus terrae]QAA21168.1 metal-dependent phosphohydrolase [Sporolactobacillus terrae]QAA24141.1 metal-dependent phosphohydrolase [Sporolactobacillus terrae]UAK15950.1 metal-dependent phosphohydrolase [Sporolactobacillus terrae]BBN97302.1 hypothetical protein St703_00070 [Sporolactobacillus terrae]